MAVRPTLLVFPLLLLLLLCGSGGASEWEEDLCEGSPDDPDRDCSVKPRAPPRTPPAQPDHHDSHSKQDKKKKKDKKKKQKKKQKKPAGKAWVETNVLVKARHGTFLVNKYDRYVGKSMQLYGEWSDRELDIPAALLEKGDTVLDIGANQGMFTVPFAKLVGPDGAVHAFEPYRPMFQLLNANVALNSLLNVWTYQAGVGAEAGVGQGEESVPWEMSSFAAGSEYNYGGLPIKQKSVGQAPPLPVGYTFPIVTVDSLRLSACHYMKIDVQGMELDVLRGAEHTIKQFSPHILCEAEASKGDRTGQLDPVKVRLVEEELFELLTSFVPSYRCYHQQPQLWNPDNFKQEKKNIFANIMSFNLICTAQFRMPTENKCREVKHNPDGNLCVFESYKSLD